MPDANSPTFRLMSAPMWIIAGLLAWFVVGCGVLAAIDHNDQRLFRWASSCPLPFGYELTVILWPLIVAYALCRRQLDSRR